MKPDHQDNDQNPKTGTQRSLQKSGEAMHDYTRKYVASAGMRNAVDTHARQNASDKTEPDKTIKPNSYRIVKSFLGIRDQN